MIKTFNVDLDIVDCKYIQITTREQQLILVKTINSIVYSYVHDDQYDLILRIVDSNTDLIYIL